MSKRVLREPSAQVLDKLRDLLGDVDTAELDNFFKVDWDTFDQRVREHTTARFLPAFEKAFGETEKAEIIFRHSAPYGRGDDVLTSASFLIQFDCTLKGGKQLKYKQTADLVTDIYSPDAGDYLTSYSKCMSTCSATFTGGDELLPCLTDFVVGLFDIIEPGKFVECYDEWEYDPDMGYHNNALPCILESAPCPRPEFWALDEMW